MIIATQSWQVDCGLSDCNTLAWVNITSPTGRLFTKTAHAHQWLNMRMFVRETFELHDVPEWVELRAFSKLEQLEAKWRSLRMDDYRIEPPVVVERRLPRRLPRWAAWVIGAVLAITAWAMFVLWMVGAIGSKF